MIKTASRSVIIVLLVALVTLPAQSQTLKQRSDKAYSSLAISHGRSAVDYQNLIAGYRLHDTLKQAGLFAEKAIKLSCDLNYSEGLVQSLTHLASYLILTGRTDSADHVIHEALSIAGQTHNRGSLGMIWFNLGRVSLWRNDVKTALSRFDSAAKFAVKTDDFYVAGISYNRRGECQKLLGKKQEFISSLSMAVKFFDKLPDPVLTPGALINVGINYADAGMISQANEVMLNAIKIAEATSDSISLGYLYSNIAGIFSSHTFPEKALEYNRKALKIFRAVNNFKGISYVLNNLGQYYFSTDNYDKALAHFNEAYALKLKTADWQGAVFTLCNIAEIHIRVKDAFSARKALDEANGVIVKTGDALSKAVLLNTEGNYYSLMKKPALARNFYQKSLAFAKKLNNQEIIQQNLLAISEQYQAEGKDTEALDYYKHYTAGRDSVNKINNVQSMAEMQLKYESEKSESHFREILQSKLDTVKGRYFIYGILVMALLLVVLMIIYLNHNKKITAGFLSNNFRQRYQASKKVELISENVPTKNDQASKPVLTSHHQDQIWTDLNDLIHSQKLYLDSSITLGELARKLNTNTTYLSKVINDVTGENYSNYLNNLRIKEACNLLADAANRHLTIEAIAQKVGFNSKSSFNIAFKKHTASTPSEFMANRNKSTQAQLKVR